MSRAHCGTCKSVIGTSPDGRFLYHYTMGPGVGMPCPNSGEPVAPPATGETTP